MWVVMGFRVKMPALQVPVDNAQGQVLWRFFLYPRAIISSGMVVRAVMVDMGNALPTFMNQCFWRVLESVAVAMVRVTV